MIPSDSDMPSIAHPEPHGLKMITLCEVVAADCYFQDLRQSDDD